MGQSTEHGEMQLAAGSRQRAGKESYACGVIRSLRFAVISCSGQKTGLGFGEAWSMGSKPRGRRSEDPSEIVLTQFHGASRGQRTAVQVSKFQVPS